MLRKLLIEWNNGIDHDSDTRMKKYRIKKTFGIDMVSGNWMATDQYQVQERFLFFFWIERFESRHKASAEQYMNALIALDAKK